MNYYLCTLTFAVANIALRHHIAGEEQCGKFNDDQVYSENPVTAIDEFPWIARIYFRERVEQFEPEYVLLGDSDYSNSDTEPDCDTQNKCAPVPTTYKIRDIILHPNSNSTNAMNDIAILYLESDVEYNAYVHPICLPPPTMYTADLLVQYFPITGFLNSNYVYDYDPLNTEAKKTKTVAHIIPNSRCSNVLMDQRNHTRIAPSDSTVICTTYIGNYLFLSGSALMGVNIVNSKLENYYLLGILNYGREYGTSQYDVFIKISSYINWIQSNINQPRYKNKKITL